ncbi:MAG TPA: amino acid permease [Thermoleophilaceae bacterium]|nr:amino acid permease [Thermoleophilaceae bacterium]
MRIVRGLGAPALFAIVVSTVGASIYFALGLVAGDALGLTPVVFLIAAVFLVITMMTYVEGNSLHPERGGASTLARYAFDELWSFIAGWAILLDYVIVMAIGAFSISHYLAAFWGATDDAWVEIAVAAAAIAFVAWSNVRGLSTDHLWLVTRIGLADLVVSLAVIAIGLALFFDPSLILDSIELGSAPEWGDLAFAAVIATVALTGIEAASGLAGEIRVGRRSLRRFVLVAAAAVLTVYIGISVVALMAVPVVNGGTDLAGPFVEAPVLGIVSAYDPAWLMDTMRYVVGAVGALVLLEAVNVNMLGIARLTYALVTHRQIPSLFGRLHTTYGTPYVSIAIAALVAFCLVLSADLDFLAGMFAFGAMLAFAIAHAAVIVLRFRERDRPSAYRVPLSIRVRGTAVPLPAVVGALAAIAAWVSVVILHEGARYAGGIWMAVGLTLYVIYRKGQGKTLVDRFSIPETALLDVPDQQYQSILVPVFNDPIDDDIVGTAGRLAAEEWEEGEGGPIIEALYVVEIPMSLPLDARVPEERIAEGRRALGRAKAVGEEYENVEVATALVRGRSVGATIVDEARRRGVNAIVLAAERPSRMRGGTLLGGRSQPLDRVLGDVTRYVVEKAPCRVILTAPPAGDEESRTAVGPA